MKGDSHIELYGALKHFTVTTEGPPESFVNDVSDNTILVPGEEDDQPLAEAVVEIMQQSTFDIEDIEAISEHVEVDDDNAPAPENVPAENLVVEEVFDTVWKEINVCNRMKIGLPTQNTSINFPVSLSPSLMDIFELLYLRRSSRR